MVCCGLAFIESEPVLCASRIALEWAIAEPLQAVHQGST